MRLLLDTHVFLWLISGDPRLPANIRDSIRDLDNEVYQAGSDARRGEPAWMPCVCRL